MKRIGIILASVREKRVGESVAKHVLKLAAESKAVAACDAFIIVTAEYNHGSK